MIRIQYTTLAERTGFNNGHAISRPTSYGSFDLPTLEKTLVEIKKTKTKLVRMFFNMEWALDGDVLGKYNEEHKVFHRELFKLLCKYDLTPMIVFISDVPNRKVYREHAAAATNNPDLLIHANFEKFKNRRNSGMHECFWPIINSYCSQVLKQGAEVFKENQKLWTNYVTVEFENEGGYVVDSEFAADSSIPYGTYPSNFAAMLDDRLYGPNAVNLYGAVYMPPSYEAMQGFAREIETSLGSWTKASPWVNLHLYVPYETGDTIDTLEKKLKARLAELLLIVDATPALAKKPVALTEFGVSKLPLELRKVYLVELAKRLAKMSRVVFAVAYAMTEVTWNGTAFTKSNWAILDFQELKYPLGFHPPADVT